MRFSIIGAPRQRLDLGETPAQAWWDWIEDVSAGTSVICAPFHNPLRLAEDIAALDIVSRARFDLGYRRGLAVGGGGFGPQSVAYALNAGIT